MIFLEIVFWALILLYIFCYIVQCCETILEFICEGSRSFKSKKEFLDRLSPLFILSEIIECLKKRIKEYEELPDFNNKK